MKSYQRTDKLMMGEKFGKLISNLSCHNYSFETGTNY